MTFAYNMFILAILASAAGVQLLPVPDAIVSPRFIPHLCQISSQAAEEMLRPRWENGAGDVAHIPACIPACKRVVPRAVSWGAAPSPAPGSSAVCRVTPFCNNHMGSDLGVLRACSWQKIKVHWITICSYLLKYHATILMGASCGNQGLTQAAYSRSWKNE